MPALGAVSLRLASALLVGLSLGSAGSVVAAPCRQPALSTIQTEITDANNLLVPVAVDGLTTKFLFDTGADQSLVSEGLARELGLPSAMAATPLLIGASGRPIREWTTAHSLAIGGLARGPSFLAVVPDATVITPEARGLFGANFLARWDVELDLAAHRIALFGHASCGAESAYWTRNPTAVPLQIGTSGRILLSMTLDGTPIRVLLDTGASQTVMSFQTARTLFHLEPDSPGMVVKRGTLTSDGGSLRTATKSFRTLALGGISFSNPAIDVIDMRTAPGQTMPFDLILGVEHLRQMRLYIAYRERMLYGSMAR